MADEEVDYITVVQAIKLISTTFNGNPIQLREFIEGVEAVIHPSQHPLLLKFIESKITGEAKDRLLARSERHTWAQIKLILEEITKSDSRRSQECFRQKYYITLWNPNRNCNQSRVKF